MKNRGQLATALLLAMSLNAFGQGTQADYDRANKLQENCRHKVFRDRVQAHWVGDDYFWYRVKTSRDGFEFVVVNAKSAERELAFDHAALANKLGKRIKREIDPNRLPFSQIRYFPSDNSIEFTYQGEWHWNRANGALTKIEAGKTRKEGVQKVQTIPRLDDRGRAGSRSPDGKWEVLIKDQQVVLRNIRKGADSDSRLTSTGSEDNHFRSGDIFWAPDSKKFVVLQTTKGQRHDVSFVESSPRDQTQPKLHTFQYLKPGDKIPQSKPHLFEVESAKEIPVSDELFPNPWLNRPRVRWHRDSSRFFFVYNQRGHQVLRVIAVDGKTGATKAVADESPDTFVDYAYKQYLRFIDIKDELIWMSERSGWNHLYLIDSKSGEVKNAITQGEWVVRGIDHVDFKKRQVWFRASGMHQDQDPYYIHHGRVDLDGKNLIWLTHGDGTHTISMSPNRKYLIDSYSRVDLPPVTQLTRVSDGKVLCHLEKADNNALLETGWQTPERFVSKARDGKTNIYGIIMRPTNFDPKKKYPIIEKIYAGPHGSFVPKRFYSYLTAQSVAELGFIVVQIDGMGTSNRSKAFHDVCWKNLGDSGFPDRILWIKAAAKKYPYMDTSRVGIYGGSAGGQSSTRALLAFGDFYKVAVSDCGCHDNRMDKIWWNELWMSWPIGPHYTEQSNVTQAHRLTGKLMLTVGELDRNVDPASTMQVVNALIKADKDFDLVVFPGGGHGIGESRYGKRKRRDFFVRHLHHVEPRCR